MSNDKKRKNIPEYICAHKTNTKWLSSSMIEAFVLMNKMCVDTKLEYFNKKGKLTKLKKSTFDELSIIISIKCDILLYKKSKIVVPYANTSVHDPSYRDYKIPFNDFIKIMASDMMSVSDNEYSIVSNDDSNTSFFEFAYPTALIVKDIAVKSGVHGDSVINVYLDI